MAEHGLRAVNAHHLQRLPLGFVGGDGETWEQRELISTEDAREGVAVSGANRELGDDGLLPIAGALGDDANQECVGLDPQESDLVI